MAVFQTMQDDTKRHPPLLLPADPCEAMIDRSLATGDMHGLVVDGAAVRPAVVFPLPDTACELKSLAAHPQSQGRPRRADAARCRVMYVGTAETGTAFYTRFGSTPSHGVVGFFIDNSSEPLFENGVRCRDMPYLKKTPH